MTKIDVGKEPLTDFQSLKAKNMPHLDAATSLVNGILYGATSLAATVTWYVFGCQNLQ